MKNIATLFIGLLLTVLPITSQAQYSDDLSIDRQGFTRSATTVGSRVVQFQSGLNYEYYYQTQKNSSGIIFRVDESKTFSQNFDFRLGLTERLEFIASGEYAYADPKYIEYGYDYGINDTFLLRKITGGIKGNIINTKSKFNLALGFNFGLFNFGTPGRSGPDRYPAGEVMIALSQKWWRFTLSTSFSLISTSITPWYGFLIFNPNATLKFEFNQKFNAFVGYHIPNLDDHQNMFGEGGLQWKINKDIQLDIFSGTYIDQNRGPRHYSYWFIEAGFTARLDWRKDEVNPVLD